MLTSVEWCTLREQCGKVLVCACVWQPEIDRHSKRCMEGMINEKRIKVWQYDEFRSVKINEMPTLMCGCSCEGKACQVSVSVNKCVFSSAVLTSIHKSAEKSWLTLLTSLDLRLLTSNAQALNSLLLMWWTTDAKAPLDCFHLMLCDRSLCWLNICDTTPVCNNVIWCWFIYHVLNLVCDNLSFTVSDSECSVKMFLSVCP